MLAVGKHREKLAILERLGIEAVALRDWRPAPASLVVEATGRPGGFECAIAAVKPRGTLILKSTVTETPNIDLAPVVVSEIRVIGSRCGPFPPALRALETGSIDVRSLVCDRIPLRDADEALRLADAPGALKVLVETA